MAKDLSIALLLDFYGEMLTDKQREVVSCYYDEDLSLSEIAAHSGISRQGVRDSIKRAEQQLIEFEEKLGFVSRFHHAQRELDEITACAKEIGEQNRRSAFSAGTDRRVERILSAVQRVNELL